MIVPTHDHRLAAREHPGTWPVMRQRWAGLLFLHWKVNATVLAERLPAGLHVDTFDGAAWLGVVPFFMHRIRPVGFPPVPWLSWFMELNVRTYVHDDNGNPGVWFFSLDCNQPVAVELGRRAFHLPYHHAKMSSDTHGERMIYKCCRKTTGSLEAVFEYDPPVDPKPAKPGSLEWFLIERYQLFAANPAGDIFSGRVHHRPYEIAPAFCQRWSIEPLRWNGFVEPTEPPPSILTASPVDVKIFPLRKWDAHAPS